MSSATLKYALGRRLGVQPAGMGCRRGPLGLGLWMEHHNNNFLSQAAPLSCGHQLQGARTLSSYGSGGAGPSKNGPGTMGAGSYRRVLRSPKIQVTRPEPPRGWSAKRFGLRQNAVTVFPGDFGDTEDLREGAEKAFKGPERSVSEFQEAGRKEQENIQEILRKEELERREKRQKRIERAKNPPIHETKIDDLGRTSARGTRKTAFARAWMQPGQGEIVVNKKDYADYFIRESLRNHILEPFVITDTLGQFDIVANTHGGGHSGQAGAIRLAIARCLNFYNPDLYRPPLKFKKLLTRDPRMVERKKIGLVKARKAPTWVKR